MHESNEIKINISNILKIIFNICFPTPSHKPKNPLKNPKIIYDKHYRIVKQYENYIKDVFRICILTN